MLVDVSGRATANLCPDPPGISGDDPRVERYRALLEVSESILAHRELAPLFSDLAQLLHPLVRFDYIGLILFDAERNTTRLHILETQQPAEAAAVSAPAGRSCLPRTPPSPPVRSN